MKKLIINIITGVVIIGILYLGGVFVYNKYIKKIDTIEQFDKLNYRVDSLEQLLKTVDLKIDTINYNVKNIKTSIDTLKKGQNIIFNAIIEDTQIEDDITFWDYFKL